MKHLVSAIQFLSILPLGKSACFEPKEMIQWFPVTGLILGAMLSLFDLAVSLCWHRPAAAVLDVIFLVIVTGALHIDGLGDTADGLYGSRPVEKALAIMKDSRIGAMGVAAIICGLAVKWAGIMSIDKYRSLFLLIIPAYSRGAMIFGFRFLKYGRSEGGTGHAFFGEPLKISAFYMLIIPIVISLFAGWRGIWLNLIFVLTVALILIFYKRRMGCITGDMLGAMCEVTESVLFLMISVR